MVSSGFSDPVYASKMITVLLMTSYKTVGARGLR